MGLISFLAITVLVFSLPLIVLQFGKTWLMILVPIYLIVGNIFAESFVTIFGSYQSLAIPIYGAIFLVTDTISEHFGKKEAARAVKIGFMTQVLFLSIALIIINSPIEPSKLDLYKKIFVTLPRLVAGSFIAYLISQWWDVHIYHYLKSKYKHLFIRNTVSTITSQLLDTIIFLTIAFAGVKPFNTLETFFIFVITTWLFKVFVAILDYPFIHYSVKLYAKRRV